jgi:hypothetical protein
MTPAQIVSSLKRIEAKLTQIVAALDQMGAIKAQRDQLAQVFGPGQAALDQMAKNRRIQPPGRAKASAAPGRAQASPLPAALPDAPPSPAAPPATAVAE